MICRYRLLVLHKYQNKTMNNRISLTKIITFWNLQYVYLVDIILIIVPFVRMWKITMLATMYALLLHTSDNNNHQQLYVLLGVDTRHWALEMRYWNFFWWVSQFCNLKNSRGQKGLNWICLNGPLRKDYLSWYLI